MSGAAWAVAAGIGFGMFQSLNRRAVSGMDVFLATFLQLFISALVLAVATALTVDLNLLKGLSRSALANFAMAGFVHFFVGWTFLNIAQKLIGAARTSPLTGTNPLFGAVIAAVTLREFPTWLTLAGIVLMVAGVYVISNRTAPNGPEGESSPGAVDRPTLWRGSLFALAASLSWALSPIFIREGLKELPSPLLGVTIGMSASVAAYGAALAVRWTRQRSLQATADALAFKLAAGVLVGLSTWGRWVALDLAPVAVVLALSLSSVPVVILLSPIVSGKHQEQVTAALWAGAALIVGGALLLILLP